jgi:antitoxin ChpS
MSNEQAPTVPESKPAVGPRYTLDQLLAESDYSQPCSTEDREWLTSLPVGRELL